MILYFLPVLSRDCGMLRTYNIFQEVKLTNILSTYIICKQLEPNNYYWKFVKIRMFGDKLLIIM